MEPLKIYYTGVDQGDGSLGVEFFLDYHLIELLEEAEPEAYRGEGGGCFMVTGGISGMQIRTVTEVLEQIVYLAESEQESLLCPLQ